MSLSSSLYRLQQIDSAIDKTVSRLQEIERILSGSEQLKEAEKRLEEAQQNLEKVNHNLHQAENRVRDQRFKIEQSESTLYSGRIHVPKELQDLQNEVAALKRYLSVLEDQQIEAMLASEEAEGQAAQARTNYNDVRALVIESNARLVAEQSALQQNSDRLAIERNAAEQAIPTEGLAAYQRLRTSRRGVAVAAIQDRSCSACGSNLTPAVVQSAATQLTNCPSCGRFLYNG